MTFEFWHQVSGQYFGSREFRAFPCQCAEVAFMIKPTPGTVLFVYPSRSCSFFLCRLPKWRARSRGWRASHMHHASETCSLLQLPTRAAATSLASRICCVWLRSHAMWTVPRGSVPSVRWRRCTGRGGQGGRLRPFYACKVIPCNFARQKLFKRLTQRWCLQSGL